MKTGFDVGPENFPVLVGAPPGFVVHTYQRSFVAPFRGERVREWLNDPATFTEG